MTDETNNIALFERYSNNSLSDNERRDFEARLAYDTELKNEYDNYLILEKSIKDHYREKLKVKLKSIDPKLDNSLKVKKKVLFSLVGSLSIAAVIVVGLFIFQQLTSSSDEKFVAKHWPYEEGLPVKMSVKDTYDDAMNAFKMNELVTAQELLNDIHSDTAFYYKAIIYYEQKDFKRAAKNFEKIDSLSAFYNEAQFRLALVEVINKNVERSVNILKNHVSNKTAFRLQAIEVLEKM